jgi:formylglycine-generating enzyme required for sulfatase activity
MLPDKHQWILTQFEPEGDPWLLDGIARQLAEDGNLEGAAAVWDRAFGVAPEVAEIRQRRREVLDRLAVVEHGIRFRYVPAGPFLMGSNDGEEDEHPWHPVWLEPFWLAETPMSWEDYCHLMDWEAPPLGVPPEWIVEGRIQTRPNGLDRGRFHLCESNKVRWRYCEDQGRRGWPPANDPANPLCYEAKPMVGVAWQEAEELTERLSTATVRYGLPTEAQWEKAARGGRIGARHTWGDEPPSPANCDFDRFREFSIQPMRHFAPNGYGLFAMNGGVWEWTNDWYDRDYYRHSPDADPDGPETGEERVLRGGSWADCAAAVTVTFRMSRGSSSWREGRWGVRRAPNIGFRLCRVEIQSG